MSDTLILTVTREVVLLKFDHGVSFEEVLVAAERQELEYISRHDENLFYEQYPGEVDNGPIAFLRKAWEERSMRERGYWGRPGTAMPNYRDDQWPRKCRFAFFRR